MVEDSRITVPQVVKMKREGRKIAVLTAYDYPTARIIDEEGVPIILIGDSVGMVIAGYETTLPVTMEEMIYHARAVARARKRALLVADMPFLSYQVGIEEARRNAGRLLKEGMVEAVKIEGGRRMADTIKALVDMDIPVMGHIGLTPQSIHRMGGYRWQGRSPEERRRLLDDAKAVEEAGAFSIVLEGIPAGLAKEITETLTIPTIGIGAGPHCDGQVLVLHDMLGVDPRFKPLFVKRYADLYGVIKGAVREYKREVEEGLFPGEGFYIP